MVRHLLRATAAIGLLLASVASHATASNKELEARANDLDARLATVERATQRLVQLQQQIDAARQDLRMLRGQIEEAKHGPGGLWERKTHFQSSAISEPLAGRAEASSTELRIPVRLMVSRLWAPGWTAMLRRKAGTKLVRLTRTE